MLGTARDADKQCVAAGLPKVEFNWIDGRCTLAKVWDSISRDVLEVPQAKRD